MLYYLTFVAVGAVLVVLVLGLLNMGRVPKPGPNAAEDGARITNMSQQLMRWRVGLQFLAIVIIMLVVYMTR